MKQWEFDPERGFMHHSGELVLVLANPEITVGEGQLSPEATEVIQVKERRDSIEVDYRWNIGDRAYSGKGELSQNEFGVVWQLQVSPEDNQPWLLVSTTEGTGSATGWRDAGALKIFHGDNIRGVSQNTNLLNGSYVIPISDWVKPLNAGRWQSFPGFWLFDPQSELGLVSGVLSQDVWKHLVARKAASGSTVSWEGRMIPPGIKARPYSAGEAYASEPIFFGLVKASRPGDAFAGYLEMLEKRLHPCKNKSLLTHAAFWDSWNDRQPHFWDVSIPLIRRTMGVLTKRFPTVRSLEIDDGYAFAGFHEIPADLWTNLEEGADHPAHRSMVQKARRLGAGFLYEEDMATARDRFPLGVDEAARIIREAGYVPAVWLGLNVVKNAAIVNEHPEWFVGYQPGEGDDPELDLVFGEMAENRFHIFDPSVPAAREYLCQVFEVLFRQWGFSSFKLDFWSYAFENDGFRLRYPDRTALEWRRWLFETIREYLPESSYFVIGCDISTGNPFLCTWVDNIRYGIDIGNGKWENIRYSALTGTFLLHVKAARFYLLNPDSIGVLKNLPESEKQCFLAWCAVTRSLCEIAGDLAVNTRDEIGILQKLLLAPKNGGDVHFVEYGHIEENMPAGILFAPGDLFSDAIAPEHLPEGVLAVFNWSDEVCTISVDLGEVVGSGEEEFLEADFFNSTSYTSRSCKWMISLPPRSVRMSHLSRVGTSHAKIIESCWRVNQIRRTSDRLQLSLHGDSTEGFVLYWPGENTPEIELADVPCRIQSEGERIYRICPISDGALRDWNLTLKT